MKESDITCAFAVTNVDKRILSNSSSGGVFYLLARYVIENLSGIVYGATVENGIVYHKRIDNLAEIYRITQSKYVQSDLKSTFKECALDLSKGFNVLFVGTPCQIVGLTQFLLSKKIDISKLIKVDFICHGVPKKSYWDMYTKETCGFNYIESVIFRKKDKGWENYFLEIKANHVHVKESYKTNPFFKAFLGNYILLDSCYDCKFKGENRESDITLGDFWGIKYYYPDYYNKNGVSLVIVRNNLDFFIQAMSKCAKINPVDRDVSLVTNKSYYLSAKKPLDFDEKLKLIDSIGISQSFKSSKINCVKSKLKKIILNLISRTANITNRSKLNINSFNLGLITDYGYSNFGNRLQNYALRLVLSRKGFKVVNLTMPYDYISLNKYFSKEKRLVRKRTHYIKRTCGATGEKTYFFDYSVQSRESCKNLKNIIIGSDQIWNYTYHGGNMPFNLGYFNDNVERNYVSYAASIGTNFIAKDKVDLFKNQLFKFKAISVREHTAEKILGELGFETQTVLDPTLLLSKQEWDDSISTYSHISTPKNPFVLKYLLRTSYENKFEIDVVDLLDYFSPYYVSNHFDFVKLIRESSIVVTDSYHAFIFSIIYKKKIILLPRESMKSRFESICFDFGINYECGKLIDLSLIDDVKYLNLKEKSLRFLNDNIFVT